MSLVCKLKVVSFEETNKERAVSLQVGKWELVYVAIKPGAMRPESAGTSWFDTEKQANAHFDSFKTHYLYCVCMARLESPQRSQKKYLHG